ncbi:hypothetical protein BDV98DRAFT_614504 [Pterulicium gracile]|uniref:Uncharacterized protein n=1 Tax=Pterulicium gracile TaxID=1884261 RepID=A0A5C3QC30_9AGAR|nr:hypothetical protein BDV98DRAFT_614504 [Pterula gracilis]
MYEELVQLVHGVQAYERARDFIVALRAYLILIFGDMPAVAGIMRIKGPAAVHPCRVCSIPGIRDTSNGKNTSYYTPLHRANNIYEFEDLPIRTHEQFVKQSKWVADGRKKSNAECTRRSRSCGINGTPLLIRLLSLSVPALDFMHILENILPLLGLDEGSEKYQISSTVLAAIGEACSAAGDTIPACFGARVPNIYTVRHFFKAETWILFATLFGFTVLYNRFKKPQYYTHFVKLVGLINVCLQFELTHDDINTLEKGLINWVKGYERCVGSFLLTQ